LALKLSEGEAELRTLTRHKISTRITQPEIWIFLNRAHVLIRAELQTLAPEMYLKPSEEVTLEDNEDGNEIGLSSTSSNFDNLYRVERKAPGGTRFYAIEGGSAISPNESVHGLVSFVVEHRCLKLYAPGGRTGGTYRVLSHVAPVKLTDANSYFQIPSQLELPMLYRAVGLIHVTDGDGAAAKKAWDGLADEEIKRVTGSLDKQQGIHQDTSGLRRVMGR
jgi:hypothetical protein